MRKQVRPSAPELWSENQEKWKQKWLDLRGRNPSAQFAWYRVGNQSAYEIALPVLKEMTPAHCAFCDAFPVHGVSKETIEHFQPKGDNRFIGEAYTWGNLYYCCDACQSAKLSQWDDRLVRPDADDYHHQHFFEFTYSTGRIKPNTVAASHDQRCAEVTIRLYDLDHPERRRYRKLELRKWQRAGNLSLDSFAYRDFLEKG